MISYIRVLRYSVGDLSEDKKSDLCVCLSVDINPHIYHLALACVDRSHVRVVDVANKGINVNALSSCSLDGGEQTHSA